MQPPTASIRWAVQNPDKLTPLPPPDYGAKGKLAQEKRAILFGGDATARADVIREALQEIDQGKSSPQRWWTFEGLTHVDACFDTPECLLIIEGKRTDALSPSTRWFRQRSQLWRNVEVAQELAAGRQFGVVLGVETEASGRTALKQAASTLDSSYPHLTPPQQAELDRHLLGFVVWSDVVASFKLPPSVLLDNCENSGAH